MATGIVQHTAPHPSLSTTPVAADLPFRHHHCFSASGVPFNTPARGHVDSDRISLLPGQLITDGRCALERPARSCATLPDLCEWLNWC